MVSEDSLILFHDAPNVLWKELSSSETSWVAQELFFDVSGAENIFASTPKSECMELPPLTDDTSLSVDFRIYSPEVIEIMDSTSECLVDGGIADSTQMEDVGFVMVVDGMSIDWGEDINVEDLPDYF